MSNSYNTQPIVLDTDTTSWRQNQTLVSQSSNALAGIRPFKITLEAASATSAGTVTITAPSDGTPLYAPLSVSAAVPASTIIYSDNLTQPLTWRDFAATGLTATATKLYIWYRA